MWKSTWNSRIGFSGRDNGADEAGIKKKSKLGCWDVHLIVGKSDMEEDSHSVL